MENQTSPLFLLYSIAVFQLLVLLLIFFKKRRGRRCEQFLFLSLILTLTIIIAEFLLTWSAYIVYVPFLIGISFPLPLLLGPCLYGLVIIDSKEVSKDLGILAKPWYLIHFLPFLFAILYQWTFYNTSSDAKLEIYDSQIVTETAFHSRIYILEVVLMATHLLLYVIWAARHRRKTSVNQTNTSILVIFTIVAALLFIHAFLLFFNFQYYALVYCSLIALLGFLGFWLQWILLFPQSLEKKEKYKNSGLPDSVLSKEALRIQSIVEQNRSYLNPDLKLGDLAEIVNMSSHHLSQVINQQLNKNFADFVNEYRVAFAKLLISQKKANRTFKEIAYESGFNSKNSFNRAFKKFTKCSPTEFYEQQSGD